jgi:hypothetical protein
VIYEKYVNSRFGAILEADQPFTFQDEGDYDSAALLTRDAWWKMYADEPFFLAEEDQDADIDGDFFVGGFDIVGSAIRQGKLLWQISTPSFQNLRFLLEGEANYYRFLSLKADHPLVPTFQIDLLWHTHILTSIQRYNEDCIAIRGEKFHHDDSFDDRTQGSDLDVAFHQTCELWKKNYGTSYRVAGAMYRGEPPSAFFNPSWTPLSLVTALEFNLEGKWSDVHEKIALEEKWADLQDKWKHQAPALDAGGCGGGGCSGGGCSAPANTAGACGGGGCSGGGCSAPAKA